MNRKKSFYTRLGNSITGIAILALVWMLWTQELAPYWHQYQDMASFEATSTETAAPTVTPVATATSTPIPAVTVEATKVPTNTPIPTATPDTKTNYLLEIPSADIKWLVHHITPAEVTEDPWGISKSLLDEYGVVDYPHLQYPGEPGLVAIAGHSDISGNPFWNLYKVNPKDLIYVTLKDGTKYTYYVYKTAVVDPADQVFWLARYPNELRLVSCLIGSTKKRIMIFAFQYEPKP